MLTYAATHNIQKEIFGNQFIQKLIPKLNTYICYMYIQNLIDRFIEI